VWFRRVWIVCWWCSGVGFGVGVLLVVLWRAGELDVWAVLRARGFLLSHFLGNEN
jgi:hypothetical protein